MKQDPNCLSKTKFSLGAGAGGRRVTRIKSRSNVQLSNHFDSSTCSIGIVSASRTLLPCFANSFQSRFLLSFGCLPIPSKGFFIKLISHFLSLELSSFEPHRRHPRVNCSSFLFLSLGLPKSHSSLHFCGAYPFAVWYFLNVFSRVRQSAFQARKLSSSWHSKGVGQALLLRPLKWSSTRSFASNAAITASTNAADPATAVKEAAEPIMMTLNSWFGALTLMGGAIAGVFFLFTKLETDTKTSISEGKAATAAAISEGKADTAAAIAGVNADIASFRTEMLNAFHALQVDLNLSVQTAQVEHRANQAEHRANQAEHRANQAEFRAELAQFREMQVQARALPLEPAVFVARDSQSEKLSST